MHYHRALVFFFCPYRMPCHSYWCPFLLQCIIHVHWVSLLKSVSYRSALFTGIGSFQFYNTLVIGTGVLLFLSSSILSRLLFISSAQQSEIFYLVRDEMEAINEELYTMLHREYIEEKKTASTYMYMYESCVQNRLQCV